MEDNYIIKINDSDFYREPPHYISMTKTEKETIEKFLKAIDLDKFINITIMENFVRLGDM